MWEVKKWVAMNARLQSCYMIRTDSIIGDEQSSVFEDFANYVAIRALNGNTLRYGHCGMDCDVGKLAGGHQTSDRLKKARAAVEHLKKQYPWMQFKQVDGKTWDVEPALKGKFYGVKGL